MVEQAGNLSIPKVKVENHSFEASLGYRTRACLSPNTEPWAGSLC